MKLLYDNVLVEKIEDDSVLKVFNDQYIVVRVNQVPKVLYDEKYQLADLKEGDEILCNHIVDYQIKSEKIYIVKLKDIVCIL